MNHAELYELRETYNREHILLCFNGPFSQGLIEEIGNALKKYMQSEDASSSSTLDVFAAYIEITQNIRHYAAAQGYDESEASATVVVGRDDNGRYTITAGNIVEESDARPLVERVEMLASMDKAALKAAYKDQLRKPHSDASNGAGLGLLDMARKASAPLSCSLHPCNNPGRQFYSLRVVV